MEALLAAAIAAEPRAPLAGPTRLTTENRWAIVALFKDGRNKSYIAHHLECNRRTVDAVLLRYETSGSPMSGSRSGRPRKTDEAQDTAIAVTARIERFTSPRQIARTLNFGIGRRTVDRRLQEAGLFGRVARHKRCYSEAEIRKRLAFAEGYKHWTPEQWSKVLFSDEKCFYGKGFCGRTFVRREMGTASDPENCVTKTAHPVKVNVWGCFSAAGPGYAHIFYDKMDSELYHKILSDHLLGVAKRDFKAPPPAVAQWHFLQDNAPMHKSKIVSEWLHNSGVSVLDFPPYSPDLNPIENLWAIIAREVEKQQCSTTDLLGDAVLKVWNELALEVFRKLAQSMPERCQAVIDAQGHHTKY